MADRRADADRYGPETVPPGLDLRSMGQEERSIYMAEAVKQSAADSAVTRSLAENAARHAHRAEVRADTAAEQSRATRASLYALTTQQQELRVMTNGRFDVMAVAIERIEGTLLVELGRLSRSIAALKQTSEATSEVAEDAAEWASTTGKHHLSELQMRASRGDAFLEEAARKALTLESEKKSAYVRTWSQAIAGAFTATGIVTVIVIAITRGCGG